MSSNAGKVTSSSAGQRVSPVFFKQVSREHCVRVFFVEEILPAVNEAPGSKIVTNRMALPKEWHKSGEIMTNDTAFVKFQCL